MSVQGQHELARFTHRYKVEEGGDKPPPLLLFELSVDDDAGVLESVGVGLVVMDDIGFV